MANGGSLFDDLLSLEDDFYKEGFDLGVADGDQAGRVEGRLFGLEKGFEKYAAMGKLHGRAAVWAGRTPEFGSDGGNWHTGEEAGRSRKPLSPSSVQAESPQNFEGHAPRLPINTRSQTHLRVLYALTEPSSLSTENNETSVSDFDDRLKRAQGKAKILEKLTANFKTTNQSEETSPLDRGPEPVEFATEKGDGSIEDISSLQVRR
ncbi:hypothetical protein ACLMJK_007195 [Lecanora helva]